MLFLGLTILVTLLLDQKIAEVVGPGSQALFGLAFMVALWGFISHEKKIQSPMIDLSFFSIPAFGFGSVGLLLCCITQGMTSFVTPFYLQDVLKLSPSFIGIIFLGPSLLSMVLSPVSGALTDRIGARFLLILGVLILMAAFLIGANLRADSHWLLPSASARAYRHRFGFFQYAVAGRNGELAPQRTLGYRRSASSTGFSAWDTCSASRSAGFF